MRILKSRTRKVVIIIQKVLLTISLTVIYIIGFGATFVFAMLFKRNLLRIRGKRNDTFWVDAEGYEFDIGDCKRQS